MAGVFAIHDLELKPGVTEEELQKFSEEFVVIYRVPGQEIHLLKGDRGERAGKYALLVEFDSVETRERYFPGTGPEYPPTEEYQQLVAALEPLFQRGETLMTDTRFTDYVVMATTSGRHL